MIYLVHHAEAVGPDVDPQRPLSSAGRAHAELLASRAAAHGAKPYAVWHSGKLRARQTAEAFWRACNPLAELKAIRGLQPSDPVIWVRDLLEGEEREVMLVGHMPHLPQLLRVLTGRAEAAPLEFPLHGIVALERERDARWWVERWR